MRRHFLIAFVLICTLGVAQSIDESKHTFLLNLDADTLCVNCEVSNCEALFLNAHRFRKLRKLTLQNLDCDLKYMTYFRRLRILEIKQLDFELKRTKEHYPYDLKSIVKSLDGCTKLRSLSVSDATCNYGYAKKVGSKGYFVSLSKLKTIKLENIETKRPEALAKDIRRNCLKLDTLVMTNSGLNIFNFPRRKRGLSSGLRPSFGSAIDYLEIDGYVSVGEILQYFEKDRRLSRDYANGFWRRNDSFITLGIKGRNTAKIKHLVLARSGKELSFRSSDAKAQSAYDAYVYFLTRDFCRSYYVDRLSILGGVNKDVEQFFPFYKIRTQRNSVFLEPIDTTSLPDSVVESSQTYIGTLRVGEDKYSYWLPYLKAYDNLKKRPLYWDTTKVVDRKGNTTYGNEYITPIMWESIDKTPRYFSKRKMKRIAKDYQSFAKVEKAFRKKKVIYYRISFDKEAKGNMLPELEYTRKNRAAGYSRLQGYTFTSKSRTKIESIAQSNLLGAWPTFDKEDSTYYLVFKTTKKLDSIRINWWDRGGDTLHINMPKVLSTVQRMDARTVKTTQRSSDRSLRLFTRRNKKIILPDLPKFLINLNNSLEEAGKPKLSTAQWEAMYDDYLRDPWKFYAKSNCTEKELFSVFNMQGYTALDQTTWYRQYHNVELYSGLVFTSQGLRYADKQIVLLDTEKKTYTVKYVDARDYSDTEVSYGCQVILPAKYESSVSILLLNDGLAHYSSTPYEAYRQGGANTFLLQSLPITLLDFETIMQFLENKL